LEVPNTRYQRQSHLRAVRTLWSSVIFHEPSGKRSVGPCAPLKATAGTSNVRCRFPPHTNDLESGRETKERHYLAISLNRKLGFQRTEPAQSYTTNPRSHRICTTESLCFGAPAARLGREAHSHHPLFLFRVYSRKLLLHFDACSRSRSFSASTHFQEVRILGCFWRSVHKDIKPVFPFFPPIGQQT